MRKVLTVMLIIICAISVLVLSSCASTMSNEEARTILADLAPRSQQLNKVFWGDGIKPQNKDAVPMNTVTTAQYYPVADDSPYKSVADIKTAAGEVFSQDYLASVYTMLFEGTGDIEPRFVDNKDGLLTVDICYKTYNFNTEIFPETAVIKESGAGLIRAEVDIKTGNVPDKMNITLRQQQGIWLIDSPTY